MRKPESGSNPSPHWVGLWLLAGSLLVALLLCAATLLNLRAGEQEARRRAQGVAANLSISVASDINAELNLVANALSTITRQIGREDALANGQPSDASMRLVREQAALVPFVSGLRIADRRGDVSAASTGALPINVADRPYFQQAQRSAGAVLSDPLVSRVLGQWTLIMARRIETPGGEFRGVAYAVITARHFQRMFERLSLGPQGAIALRNDGLALVARYSVSALSQDVGLGSQDISDAFGAALRDDPGAGSYITTTHMDGIRRIHAYRRLADYPLMVNTGLGVQAYTAEQSGEALRSWAFTGVVILLIFAGTAFAYFQQRREHAAHVLAARMAKQQDLLIRSEWAGIVRLLDHTIDWANHAATRMLAYPPGGLYGMPVDKALPQLAALVERHHPARGRPGAADLDGHPHAQIQLQARDGVPIWVDVSGSWVSERESVWLLVNIDQVKVSEERAHFQARHDPLTGLANRRMLDELLAHVLVAARRNGETVAVCYLDLDGFKPINDQHGHEAGDRVLRRVAERLREIARPGDLLARIGGDEFVLVFVGSGEVDGIEAALSRHTDAIREPVVLDSGAIVSVDCSIGVALSRHGEEDAASLLAQADQAMYAAKQAGRGRVRFASAHTDAQLQRFRAGSGA